MENSNEETNKLELVESNSSYLLEENFSNSANILDPKYYILKSENKDNFDYYLKEEYQPNQEVYIHKIVKSQRKDGEPIESELLLSKGHKNTIESMNEDLINKLKYAFIDSKFQHFNLISDPGDLIEIPVEQTTIQLYRYASQLKELGEKTLKEFDGDVSNRIIKIFDRLHPGNGKNIFLGWLSLLSSIMSTPIIVIVKGDPGTGKTQITEIIKDAIPKDYIIKLNNATESSLFGKANILGPNYPDKKIFYLGDLGDKNAMSNTAPYRKHIRELTSDGETTRELSDTNKPTKGPRPVLSERLTGYPTMIYSTVRDGEIEQQETDRAIEITPDLSKIQKIKEIILFYEDPTAKISKEIESIKNEWFDKLQGIFEYLISSPQKVLLPWDLTKEEYGLRDTKTVASITRKLAMINQKFRDTIEDYIIASPVDLALTLEYVEDGGLERSRLQQVYDKHGISHSFTRDDVSAMFPDSYSGIDGGKSAYRSILKPATEDFDKDGIPVLYEDKESRPYLYYFRREPKNDKATFKMPKLDFGSIEKQYPDLPWKEFYKKNKRYI